MKKGYLALFSEPVAKSKSFFFNTFRKLSLSRLNIL